MEKSLFIIKIGGNVLDDPESLDQFLDHFAALPGHKILIHGGGKIATRIGAQMGLEPQYIDGRRITDAATLQLVTMVYGGLVNKQIVAALQCRNCNSLGVTGADGNLITALRRPAGAVDFGWVGDPTPEMVDKKSFKTLLEGGFCLVFAPLTHNGTGNMLNTNADTIAAVLAQALAKDFQVKLLYCFEQEGVFEKDTHEKLKIVPVLTLAIKNELKEKGDLNGGILPKIDNALAASAAGAALVWIGNSARAGEFARTDNVLGTVVKN